jgi:4'-phosphopantetheinyl transferase
MSNLVVWIFRTDCSEGECAPLLTLLSAGEREAARRYRLARDRIRSIVCHAHLRLLIAGRTGVDPAELVFATGRFGKPLIKSPAGASDLQFNLSHSGSFGAVALADRMRVGVDIEEMIPLPSYDELERRYLSREEQEWIGALEPALRERAFYRLWAIKEAAAKAHGAGLSIPLCKIRVHLSADGAISAAYRERRWLIVDLDSMPGYAGAAAIEDRSPSIDVSLRKPSTMATIGWCDLVARGEVGHTGFVAELCARGNDGA